MNYEPACDAITVLAHLGYWKEIRPARAQDARPGPSVRLWDRLDLDPLVLLALEAEVAGNVGEASGPRLLASSAPSA